MADKIQKNYRHEIDGLRTLAVTGATLHNFWENIFPCGYLGVDMFAVISGYVITTSLANKNYSSFKEFATGFYFRRLRRLYPALIFMVIVVCLISGFIQPSFKGGTMATIRTGISALLGTSNIYLIKQSSDYFSFIAKLNPFTATWSLGC